MQTIYGIPKRKFVLSIFFGYVTYIFCAIFPWLVVSNVIKTGTQNFPSFIIFLSLALLLTYFFLANLFTFNFVSLFVATTGGFLFIICLVASNYTLTSLAYAPAEASRDVGYTGHSKIIRSYTRKEYGWGYVHPLEGVLIIKQTSDSKNFPIGKKFRFNPTDEEGNNLPKIPFWKEEIKVPSFSQGSHVDLLGKIDIPPMDIMNPINLHGVLFLKGIIAVGVDINNFTNIETNIESVDIELWVFPASFIQQHSKKEHYLSILIYYYLFSSFGCPLLGIFLGSICTRTGRKWLAKILRHLR